MDEDDREALKAVREGDIESFTHIVQKYSPKVAGFIRTKTSDANLVEDVTQTAFIKLYKAVGKVDFARPLMPYLFQIAKNELYEYWRKHVHTGRLEDSAHLVHYEETSTHSIQIDETKHAMKSLKPEQRNAILWFAEGYSYDEIAKRLGKPINTVRTLIRRARLFIQKTVKL